jgi:hypothetical protein
VRVTRSVQKGDKHSDHKVTYNNKKIYLCYRKRQEKDQTAQAQARRGEKPRTDQHKARMEPSLEPVIHIQNKETQAQHCTD